MTDWIAFMRVRSGQAGEAPAAFRAAFKHAVNRADKPFGKKLRD